MNKRRRYLAKRRRASARRQLRRGWLPDTICGRCGEPDVPVYAATCAEQPERLIGLPLGMYHCPDCGCMLVAGLPHPTLCRFCASRTHPAFDSPRERIEPPQLLPPFGTPGA